MSNLSAWPPVFSCNFVFTQPLPSYTHLIFQRTGGPHQKLLKLPQWPVDDACCPRKLLAAKDALGKLKTYDAGFEGGVDYTCDCGYNVESKQNPSKPAQDKQIR